MTQAEIETMRERVDPDSVVADRLAECDSAIKRFDAAARERAQRTRSSEPTSQDIRQTLNALDRGIKACEYQIALTGGTREQEPILPNCRPRYYAARAILAAIEGNPWPA